MSFRRPEHPRLLLVSRLLLASCVVSCAHDSAPDPVEGLTLAVHDARFSLSWTAPPSDATVVVRRGVSGPPTTADGADATTVYTGTASTTVDRCSTHGATVHYALFVKDDDGHVSEPARVSGTCTFSPFTWVLFPDSQYYVDALYRVDVAWILDQLKARNIVAVLHEGDITNNNTEAEWQIATNNLTDLDGKVPLVVSVGNHDMTGSGDTSLYNTYFPVSAAKARPGFVENHPAGKLDNYAATLTAGGTDWLVVSLRVEPTDDALAWANTLISKFPFHRVVILTHAYLGPSGSRTAVGQRIWDKLVKGNANITFVFCGHYIGGNAARLVSTGTAGNKVYQMFANYQMEPLSGNARIRLVRIDTAAGTVDVKSYSPMMKSYLTDDANQFSWSNVKLGSFSSK